MNKGTTSFLAVLGAGGARMCSAEAPGQSGFVSPSGVRALHYDDQLALFRRSACKEDQLTPTQVDAHLESIRQFDY